MPRHKGRPPVRTLTIEDCASVTFHENPAPQCPHDKLWRPLDFAQLIDEAQTNVCQEPECESNEYHPHEGESITLKLDRTFAGRHPLRDLINMVSTNDEVNLDVVDFEARLSALVQEFVTAWTWTDRAGDLLPLPSEDWERVGAELEYAELYWIVQAALYAKDPREVMYRPLAPAPISDSASG